MPTDRREFCPGRRLRWKESGHPSEAFAEISSTGRSSPASPQFSSDPCESRSCADWPDSPFGASIFAEVSRRTWRTAGNGACTLRGNSACKEWNYVGTREWTLVGILFAGNHRRGLRIFRLRQRWVDGHLPCEQREVRFLRSATTFAQRALSQQSRWNVYGRDGKSGCVRRWLWHGRGRGRLQRRRLS